MTVNSLDPVVVITGGTGSFGSAFARFLLRETGARVRLISRDEHKQDKLRAEIGSPRTTFIIADVREVDRLRVAFDGADVVVHAAALKTVPGGEIHGTEYTRTNVYGTEDVITAAVEAGVSRSLLISSDKACDAFNFYGKSKAVAEGLFVQANELGRRQALRFAVARGGNVWNSAGSVVEIWREQIRQGKTPIVNDADTTRFHLLMEDWVAFCWRTIEEMHGGEIFVPVVPAWRLGDLAEALGTGYTLNGRRDGDKDAEVLISRHEITRSKDIGWAYVIEPNETLRSVLYYREWDGKRMAEDFEYSSDAVERLAIEELRQCLSS
jgi:UDP-N-acetylglucosamine 4,6-dehydratase